jgi:protease I
VEADEDAANACVDENLCTAPAWPAHPNWMRGFLKVLGSTLEP